jgi:hypothetical protein
MMYIRVVNSITAYFFYGYLEATVRVDGAYRVPFRRDTNWFYCMPGLLLHAFSPAEGLLRNIEFFL